uniref:ATP synthase subunit 8 n=1 Tax=Ornithodoros rostratus TaxID=360320 RepID=W0FDI5_ORNRO|nr:ATP synthase F0 subunit 8 [Ornithodoros rostratus]AHF21668.1 ATP synthase subunit 8 [Ornithodoros rostratus]
MPQLFPMNWNILFLIILLILTTTLIIMYFTFFQKVKKTQLSFNSFEKNWKW